MKKESTEPEPNPYELMAAMYTSQGRADLVEKYPHLREQVYGKK